MKRHPFRTASLAAVTATLLAAPAAFADEVTRHEVTESRTVTGTVSEVTPSSRIVVTQTGGSPTTYTLDQRTVFVDESGNVVSYEQVRGKPVKIYVSESKEQPVVVERVVVTKPATTVYQTQPAPVQAAPPVTQRTETRTETTVTDD